MNRTLITIRKWIFRNSWKIIFFFWKNSVRNVKMEQYSSIPLKHMFFFAYIHTEEFHYIILTIIRIWDFIFSKISHYEKIHISFSPIIVEISENDNGIGCFIGDWSVSYDIYVQNSNFSIKLKNINFPIRNFNRVRKRYLL